MALRVNPVRVKICGITRQEDLAAACAAGADALGFVFYAKSPRNVAIAQAAALVRRLPPFVQSVGLFVDADPAFITAVLAEVPLDLLQFHGDETAADCARHQRPWIKAIRVAPETDLLKCAADFAGSRGLLLDAFVPGVPGGTGERFDWSLIPSGFPLPVVLSGGLEPENITAAVRQTRPWAVDVSSGVEQSRVIDGATVIAKGIKDASKIAQFIAKAKAA
jgi:phosphoribosylanthranilate isomerase